MQFYLLILTVLFVKFKSVRIERKKRVNNTDFSSATYLEKKDNNGFAPIWLLKIISVN